MTISTILLQQAQGDGLMQIGMIILLVVVFYFFMIRPQQKRQKDLRKFRESLQVGDSVVTSGGIYGKIRRIKENVFSVEIASNTIITVDKNCVYPSAQEALQDAAQEQKAENK